jgi:hypothetical protein
LPDLYFQFIELYLAFVRFCLILGQSAQVLRESDQAN